MFLERQKYLNDKFNAENQQEISKINLTPCDQQKTEEDEKLSTIEKADN